LRTWEEKGAQLNVLVINWLTNINLNVTFP
jgi:hypothetical protein